MKLNRGDLAERAKTVSDGVLGVWLFDSRQVVREVAQKELRTRKVYRIMNTKRRNSPSANFH